MAMNNATSTTCALPLEDVQDDKVLLRLTWIQFPREGRQSLLTTSSSSSDKYYDLYWPALYYASHKEAADYGNHTNFQNMLAGPMMETLLEEKPDPGPVCRLLGFDDGTYLTLPAGAEDGDTKTYEFAKNMMRLFVTNSKRDKYFDMSIESEAELWDLYQAAILEAQSLLKTEQQQQKKKRMSLGTVTLVGGGNKRFQPTSTTTTTENSNKNANNKTNLASTRDDDNNNNNNNNQVTFQERQSQPAAQPQPATPTRTTHKNNKKKSKDETPATPPFTTDADILNVAADAPWKTIFLEMRRYGWSRRTVPGENGTDVLIWTKPGCSYNTGTEGVDYFTSEEAVQDYVQSKVHYWKPPAWNAPPVPNNNNNNNNINARQQQQQQEAQNHRRDINISSSATIITTDSSPGTRPVPPVRSERLRRSHAIPKYTAQPSLVAYNAKERIWWRATNKKLDNSKHVKVPTLTQVKPLLHNLGIRCNESGCFVLPDSIGTSHEGGGTGPPDLTNAQLLRKYLCTKGIPFVPGKTLLSPEEQDVLHRWVSFAYVPLQHLEHALPNMNLPNDAKIQKLLSKFMFQNCDDKYFVPNVDKSGARGDFRVEGKHFFRGLAQVRDYIRRTASFSWTEDEFDESEDEVKDFMEDKALLRLWAASSPSPLLCYETSWANIQKMESMLPKRSNVFPSDSEEPNDEISEKEGSAEEQEDDCMSYSEDEEEESIEASTESEEEDAHVSSSDENSEASSQATPVLTKRKSDIKEHTKNSKKAKQDTRPWWQRESFPSNDEIQPILAKLGIFKHGKFFVMPGKDDVKNLTNIEMVRSFLCSEGIPVHETLKPNLTEDEKELLRRWISFAHVPVTQKQCVNKLNAILPLYDKIFGTERGLEFRVSPILSDLRFSKDAYTGGYFPPGIDALGRDRKVRSAHLKETMSNVRQYIRCSENLTLVPPSDKAVPDSPVKDEEFDIDKNKLLALRLWAALDPSPLRSYKVPPSYTRVAPPEAFRTNTNEISKKNSRAQPREEPVVLDCPSWWNESSLEMLQDKIEKVRTAAAKVSGRRGFTPHMTAEQLEMACDVRQRIEDKVREALSSKESLTIDDVVEEICDNFLDLSMNSLQKFLCGDAKQLVFASVHKQTEKQLQTWIQSEEGISVETPPRPVVSHEVTSSSKNETGEKDDFDNSSGAGSFVMSVEDEKGVVVSREVPKPLQKSTVEDAAKAATSEGKGSLVSNVEDQSQSHRAADMMPQDAVEKEGKDTETASAMDKDAAPEGGEIKADTIDNENDDAAKEVLEKGTNDSPNSFATAQEHSTATKGNDDHSPYFGALAQHCSPIQVARPQQSVQLQKGQKGDIKSDSRRVTAESHAGLPLLTQPGEDEYKGHGDDDEGSHDTYDEFDAFDATEPYHGLDDTIGDM